MAIIGAGYTKCIRRDRWCIYLFLFFRHIGFGIVFDPIHRYIGSGSHATFGVTHACFLTRLLICASSLICGLHGFIFIGDFIDDLIGLLHDFFGFLAFSNHGIHEIRQGFTIGIPFFYGMESRTASTIPAFCFFCCGSSRHASSLFRSISLLVIGHGSCYRGSNDFTGILGINPYDPIGSDIAMNGRFGITNDMVIGNRRTNTSPTTDTYSACGGYTFRFIFCFYIDVFGCHGGIPDMGFGGIVKHIDSHGGINRHGFRHAASHRHG